MSNTRDRVLTHFETPKREVTITHATGYFDELWVCLEMRLNSTVSQVFNVFSIKTKTEFAGQVAKFQSMCKELNTLTISSDTPTNELDCQSAVALSIWEN